MAWGEPGHYDTLAPVRGLTHAALREPEYFHAVQTEEHAVSPRNERNTTGLGINLGQLVADPSFYRRRSVFRQKGPVLTSKRSAQRID